MSNPKEVEQPTPSEDAHERLGITLVERCMLRSLETLWNGPIDITHLDRIERCLRAFLTAETLVASKVTGDPWQMGDLKNAAASPNVGTEDPFGDHLLDYEFAPPGNAHPYSTIDPYESQFLRARVVSDLRTAALAALPPWIATNGEAFEYLDAWYEGCSEEACELRARLVRTWKHADGASLPLSKDYVFSHAVFHLQPVNHANYLLGCHRAGITVCGDTQVAKICTNHVFSRWPDHLFEQFGTEFERSTRELRGPGLGMTLPPVLSLVLSRAPSRHDIPRTIVCLREEYADSRRKLWDLLREMWTCPSFEQQVSILRKLELASASMFEAAFGPRLDAMSLGIAATQSLVGMNPGTLMANLRDQDRPKARVSAISFMVKLASDMKRHLLNQRTLLRRHFTDVELREFGSSR